MRSLGVRVLPSGSAQLYHTRRGAYSTFGSNIQSAVINGGEIHCQTKDGRTMIYEVNQHGTGVRGPIRVW